MTKIDLEEKRFHSDNIHIYSCLLYSINLRGKNLTLNIRLLNMMHILQLTGVE